MSDSKPLLNLTRGKHNFENKKKKFLSKFINFNFAINEIKFGRF